MERRIFIVQSKLPKKYDTEKATETLKCMGRRFYLATENDLDPRIRYHMKDLASTFTEELIRLYY